MIIEAVHVKPTLLQPKGTKSRRGEVQRSSDEGGVLSVRTATTNHKDLDTNTTPVHPIHDSFLNNAEIIIETQQTILYGPMERSNSVARTHTHTHGFQLKSTHSTIC